MSVGEIEILKERAEKWKNGEYSTTCVRPCINIQQFVELYLKLFLLVGD